MLMLRSELAATPSPGRRIVVTSVGNRLRAFLPGADAQVELAILADHPGRLSGEGRLDRCGQVGEAPRSNPVFRTLDADSQNGQPRVGRAFGVERSLTCPPQF